MLRAFGSRFACCCSISLNPRLDLTLNPIPTFRQVGLQVWGHGFQRVRLEGVIAWKVFETWWAGD